ncbi:MAG: sigma-54-dependent Fis family transcriptional regulator [Deltaproteobacteria bacterium]|nr:MAG: sigma-54-dependent Fis family transcriptional regulator [Deltaproteobacteria bacterium]
MPDEDQATILIVDDDTNTLKGMRQFLSRPGREITAVERAREALETLGARPVDVMISDIRLPDMNGIQLMEEVRRTYPETDVILMTGYGSIQDAVEAMRMGAESYLTKPLNPDELEIVLSRILEKRALIRQNRELVRRLSGQRVSPDILGTSREIRAVLKTIREVAPTDVPVLIEGETGTGKELVARAIHRTSERAEGPFVVVNCAALHENLLESELFGHEKGAFTGAVKQKKGRFELASGGTLFLDEIGEMSLETQAKILRTLEYGTFERLGGTRSLRADVRILSATNRDLSEAIKKGTFREDLFYRLNVITLRVPPLRERKGDIPVLARAFLERFSTAQKKGIEGFSPEALRLLESYDWPGNVRELEHVIERAVILCPGREIGVESLPEHLREMAKGEEEGRSVVLPVGISLKEAEKALILKTLEAVGYHRGRAAEMLGISKRKIEYLLKAWGMGGLGKKAKKAS